MISLAIAVGKWVWDNVPEDTKLALRSSVTDVGVSAVCGQKSVEEWAGEFVGVLDKLKERTIEENDLTYVGGELKFSLNEEAKNELEAKKIIVSFELYFQDSRKQWAKCADSSQLSKLFFTKESLEEIEKNGVKFEIT